MLDMILVKKHDSSVSLRINDRLWETPIAGNDFLHNWLMLKSRDLFDSMPCEIPPVINPHELPVNRWAMLLHVTNNTLKKVEKDTNGEYTNLLFWNVGNDIRYQGMCKVIKPEVYQNLDLGFDRKKRVWNKQEPPMPAEDLVKYLVDNKIGTLLTINSYLSDKYGSHYGVELGTLLKHMGVDYVTISVDPEDMSACGYMRRDFYNHKQFSNLFILSESFAKKDIIHCAIPQDYSARPKRELPEDYDIVILSNSRWKNIESMKNAINALDVPDINLWYLAMRKLITEVMPIPYYKMNHINSILHHFYFACVNKQKHDIIGQIKTDRTVWVYGDDGWLNVCPEYYKGCLDNGEMERLFAEDGHLYLLLNASFTYLDASGPVYDMVARRLPWVNVPPMIKTEKYLGMGEIEYQDIAELNELINNYNPSDEYHRAQDLLRITYSASVDDIESVVRGLDSGGVFQSELNEHKKLIDLLVNEYLMNNETFLRSCFRRLF